MILRARAAMFALAGLVFCLCPCITSGQATPGPGAEPATVMPSVTMVPEAARPSDHFDVGAATSAYMAQIPAAARARSDAYFEGGYWFILWDFLMSVAIFWAVLRFGWSAKMRDFAGRISRFAFLQDFLYWVQFLILISLLGAPLS